MAKQAIQPASQSSCKSSTGSLSKPRSRAKIPSDPLRPWRPPCNMSISSSDLRASQLLLLSRRVTTFPVTRALRAFAGRSVSHAACKRQMTREPARKALRAGMIEKFVKPSIGCMRHTRKIRVDSLHPGNGASLRHTACKVLSGYDSSVASASAEAEYCEGSCADARNCTFLGCSCGR